MKEYQKCGGSLHIFSSLNYKQCSVCNTKYDFPLKEGQQPLIKYQR